MWAHALKYHLRMMMTPDLLVQSQPFPVFHNQIYSCLVDIPHPPLNVLCTLQISGDSGRDPMLCLASPALAGGKLRGCCALHQRGKGGGAHLPRLFSCQVAYSICCFCSVFPCLCAWNSARSSPWLRSYLLHVCWVRISLIPMILSAFNQS